MSLRGNSTIVNGSATDKTATLNVVGNNGAVTFRVYGAQAAGLMPVAPETAAEAREWEDAIAKLKTRAIPSKTKGR